MKNAVDVVITDFGDYFPTKAELSEFKAKYGDKPVTVETYRGRRRVPQWDYQLTNHASKIMHERWERGV